MDAVSGPVIPKFETNSTTFGVSLNGTGLLLRSSPKKLSFRQLISIFILYKTSE